MSSLGQILRTTSNISALGRLTYSTESFNRFFLRNQEPKNTEKQIICESFHLWDPKQVSKARAIQLPSLFWAQLRHRWSTNKCHILDIQSMPAERHPNKEIRDSSFIAFCKDVLVKSKVKLRLFIQLAQDWKRCDTHTNKDISQV